MIKHRLNIFPEASQEDFDRLVSDIEANGYDASLPITLYQGAILDGWNRWRACQQLGVTPRTTTFFGTDSEAISYTMRTNKRRNLNSSQWAAIAVEAEDLLSAIAEAVEAEKLAKQKANAANQHSEPCGKKLPQPSRDENRVTQKAAELFNTNRTYINEAKKLKETSPEAFEQIKSGEKTISEVRKSFKRAERINKIAEISKGNTELPSQKFPVIYADPPWRYEHSETDSRAIENQYPTMTLEDICAMPVPATEDAVLFLWTTAPKLEEGIKVLNSWGFSYRSCAIWDKQKMGMGYYFRIQHEILLIGVKGSIPTPEPANRPRSLFSIPYSGHSAKPHEVAEMIEAMYPELPKLELFCRSPRDGWSVWGNQSAA